jgi:glycosidase
MADRGDSDGDLRAFQVSVSARARYEIEASFFAETGPLVLNDPPAAQSLADAINRVREVERFPEHAVRGSDLLAGAVVQEAMRRVIEAWGSGIEGGVMAAARRRLEERLGDEARRLLLSFASAFPVTPVYVGERRAVEQLEGETVGRSNADLALGELLLVSLANENPAFTRFRELHDDTSLRDAAAYGQVIAAIEEQFDASSAPWPADASLLETVRAPLRACPTSLSGQIHYVRTNWAGLLGEGFVALLGRMLWALDLMEEKEEKRRGPVTLLDAEVIEGSVDAEEHFSQDRDWMPGVVLVWRHAHVWLDQLSKRYGRQMRRLDDIPDEELDSLAGAGITALWLIGIWERSEASRRIKQYRGNREALASAYAIADYRVAADLGGDGSLADLRKRAWARGVRLACDMVPNHVGIDGRWVVEHPDRLLSLERPPYPGYTFTGPDLSSDARVQIQIEDHYWGGTDAAVVFRRRDRTTGVDRFIYHGNDGVDTPWNDTAQIDYLDPEARRAVIETILEVARAFPIIRFDAAMTLARQHVQRLWHPASGMEGAIASRHEYGVSAEEFDRRLPQEFWREVVDRVAAEAPDTLLLAEAFWMLEGYFVRTLGLNRVYNSAFMHLTAAEDNAGLRRLLTRVLESDPRILGRFVNFLTSPDEEPAVGRYGKGDKYFGACTLLATLPGTPMLGHGQFEGLAERYGMEYPRAEWDERPDERLLERHRRQIHPLLRRRRMFAGSAGFCLYDVRSNGGEVIEDVYAYSNLSAREASLVLFNNSAAKVEGWIRESVPIRDLNSGQARRRGLAESLGLRSGHDDYVVFRDQVGDLEYLRRSRDLAGSGFFVSLNAYEHRVLWDFREVVDTTGAYAVLAGRLDGEGVADVAAALEELRSEPLRSAVMDLVDAARPALRGDVSPDEPGIEAACGRLLDEAARLGQTVDRRRALTSLPGDLANMAAAAAALDERPPLFDMGWLAVWAVLRCFPHGQLAGLHPECLPLGGSEHWSRLLPILIRHAAAVREWGKTRGSAGGLRRLLAALLDDEEVAGLLGLHEHQGVLWFDRDGFRSLTRALVVGGLLGSRSRALTERAGELAAAAARAEEQSGYRLERLLR